MGELIATGDGFDIWRLSLARSPSKVEFVVKNNGYTVTSTGRLLLTSPHERIVTAFVCTKESAIALCPHVKSLKTKACNHLSRLT